MKRVADIILAFVLLAVLSPVFVFAALGIFVSSKGPILYRAKRVGRGGKCFEMLKFRSMHVHSGGPVITGYKDSRVFAFGAFLRQSKIDELPQFINVLLGQMSVVGPRPEDPKIVAGHYTDWMMETLTVRPGITSSGAVYYYLHGERLIDPADPEGSYIKRILSAKLAVERAYLERASFASDFKIMARTIPTILSPAFSGVNIQPDARDLARATRWAPVRFGAQE